LSAITADSGAFAALQAIGLRADLAPAPPLPGLELVRIIEHHRSGYVLSNGSQNFSAQAHPKLKQLSAELRPAVGDFIWLDARQSMFAHTLARTSALKRAAAGEKFSEQTLAANIDKVLIVCGLDRDYSERRIERYLTLVHGCNIKAAVILSKADQHPDGPELLAALQARIGDIKIYALDVRDPAQALVVKDEIGPGQTGVLLGSSGAGKSTLSNALSNLEVMQTGTVRARDGRGRHTTVHRALLRLPWGACLIDSPGLREIKLTGDEDLGAQTVSDIDALSGECRFRDCAHENEPGCAVLQAIESGQLSGDRFDNFKKLELEALTAKRYKSADKSMHKRLRR
jgi:ribosome biogenesis GTPase / thiamine phosphate phosphatase